MKMKSVKLFQLPGYAAFIALVGSFVWSFYEWAKLPPELIFQVLPIHSPVGVTILVPIVFLATLFLGEVLNTWLTEAYQFSAYYTEWDQKIVCWFLQKIRKSRKPLTGWQTGQVFLHQFGREATLVKCIAPNAFTSLRGGDLGFRPKLVNSFSVPSWVVNLVS